MWRSLGVCAEQRCFLISGEQFVTHGISPVLQYIIIILTCFLYQKKNSFCKADIDIADGCIGISIILYNIQYAGVLLQLFGLLQMHLSCLIEAQSVSFVQVEYSNCKNI